MNLRRYGERLRRFGLSKESSGTIRSCLWQFSSPLDIHLLELFFIRSAVFGGGRPCFLEYTTSSISNHKRFLQREREAAKASAPMKDEEEGSAEASQEKYLDE